MLFLDAFNNTCEIAFVAFAIHLILIGYLIFKSSFIPRILGALLIIADFGYMIQSLAAFLFPNLDVSIILFTALGELLFTLWLLIRGVNVERWEQRALETA